jgi:hypothetical protein
MKKNVPELKAENKNVTSQRFKRQILTSWPHGKKMSQYRRLAIMASISASNEALLSSPGNNCRTVLHWLTDRRLCIF